jgi:multimeric flavodoxin WrbA
MALVIGINGSPRKGWNTHTLVKNALDGAASQGAETELINLYDLSFQGCVSCFSCKKKGSTALGRCARNDDLKPVLEKIDTCDALILGSPVYISEVTAAMRALIERLTFQYITYRADGSTFYKGKLPTLCIYTMNVPETLIVKSGYEDKFKAYSLLFERILKGPSRFMYSCETLQTNKYDDYEMTMFKEADRKKKREQDFPLDCRGAFEMGSDLVKS